MIYNTNMNIAKYFLLPTMCAMLVVPQIILAAEKDVCRNESIIFHTPRPDSSGEFTEIIFYTFADIKTSSLFANLNEKSQPVEYRTLESGDFIRAKVRIPADIDGEIDAEIGAGKIGRCNDSITFSFTKNQSVN